MGYKAYPITGELKIYLILNHKDQKEDLMTYFDFFLFQSTPLNQRTILVALNGSLEFILTLHPTLQIVIGQ